MALGTYLPPEKETISFLKQCYVTCLLGRGHSFSDMLYKNIIKTIKWLFTNLLYSNKNRFFLSTISASFSKKNIYKKKSGYTI